VLENILEDIDKVPTIYSKNHDSKEYKRMFGRNRMNCLIYPEDKKKGYWDLWMTIILLLTCFSTPLTIAFTDTEKQSIFDDPLNFTIDFFFLLDIIVIFNSAYYTENMDLVSDRKKIAKHYLTGWFIIDFLAILPFDIIL
jgi:hypothetical protein